MLKNKGFVLLETIIVMSVLLIGMILLYSNYNKIFMNSGKISYYDNVEDLYTAYYVYINRLNMDVDENKIVNVKNDDFLKNLNIVKIYFINKDTFGKLYDNKSSNCETFDSLDCFDGSTIAYLKSIENKAEVDKCENNNDCLTIVKIERDGHYYFAKYEAYDVKQTDNGSTAWEFQFTGGEQIFTVPKTGTYKIETWGAAGGYGYDSTRSTGGGGYGGYSIGYVELEKNNIIYVNIGGKGEDNCQTRSCLGGYNGGSNSSKWANGDGTGLYTGGGGGATHIAKQSGLLSTLSGNQNNILIVSGGGGGGDYYPEYGGLSSGGSAGGYKGVDSLYINNNTVANTAGTQTSGYAFGTGGTTYVEDSCGGSGGGYYGGISQYQHSTGAGGSGYIGNSLLTNKSMYCYNCTESSDVSTKTISTTCHSATPTTNCAKEGNGYAKITYVG